MKPEISHPFLALGDSYTIGEGVAEAERWPEIVAARLRTRGMPVERPRIVARTGWTTADLEAAIAEAVPNGAYDVVSLLIGVNDQYRGGRPAEYAARFERISARAIGLARGEPGRLLVISTPDWGVTPFAEGQDRAAIAREIDALNAAAEASTRAAGATWLDITHISRALGSNPDGLAADRLHPSGVQYERWADLIAPRIALALGHGPLAG